MEMSQAFVFTYQSQSTQNCKQKYPSTSWTLCASTSGMPDLKKKNTQTDKSVWLSNIRNTYYR